MKTFPFWPTVTPPQPKAAPSGALTEEKLREAMNLLHTDLPERPRFDLWPQNLDPTGIYEINYGLADFRIRPGRRFVLVPAARLELIAQRLRQLGCDVEIEPRMRPVARGRQF